MYKANETKYILSKLALGKTVLSVLNNKVIYSLFNLHLIKQIKKLSNLLAVFLDPC